MNRNSRSPPVHTKDELILTNDPPRISEIHGDGDLTKTHITNL